MSAQLQILPTASTPAPLTLCRDTTPSIPAAQGTPAIIPHHTLKYNAHTLTTWFPADRPRDKMLNQGPRSLTDSELLSILIGPDTPAHTAVDLARQILADCHNNLRELGKRSIPELMKISGIGKAKAAAIAAAVELGRRRQAVSALKHRSIGSTYDAAAFLVPLLQDYTREVFCALYLAQNGSMLKFEIVSEGGISSTVVDPRIIFKKALELNAASLIAAHNHPSGNAKPSKADIALTEKLNQASRLLDLELLDHLIISGNGYYSFADSGLLKTAS